jgi:hypothetical protein
MTMTPTTIHYDKLAGSRMMRGAIWAVVAVITAPEVVDIIDVGPDPLVKGIWAGVFALFASRLTSFVSRKFGNPESTLLVDGPSYTTSTDNGAAG